MEKNKNVDYNNQELNLNLISLDKFERLPQKKQNEDETDNLKKKKSKQRKKNKLSLDNAVITTTTEVTPIVSKPTEPTTQLPNKNNHYVNVTTIKKDDKSTKILPLPSQYLPFNEHLQKNIPPIPYPQMNKQNFQTPIHYPQLYNLRPVRPVYPINPMHSPNYIHKERQVHLRREKVQPIPIINPNNRKPIEIIDPSNQKQVGLVKHSREHMQNNEVKKKIKAQRLLYNPKSEYQEMIIYKIPDMMIIETNYVPMSFPTTELWFEHLNSLLTSRERTHDNNYCIAIDCEMVGVGKEGKFSSLARVSIVNYYGEVILDKFVKPTREIIDYRTQFSGITPELLIDANDFKEVQKEVEDIMQDHIIVGQSIYFDFKALKTGHSKHLIRDTSLYNTIFGIETEKSGTPSLKKLAKDVLGIDIQEGEHDSIEDARASMILYRHRQAEWEEYLKTNGFPKQRGCKICGSFSHVVRDCPNKIKKKNKKDKINSDNQDDQNDNDMIDRDEYNRDPNTSRYYSYSQPNYKNNNSFGACTYPHYNYRNTNRYSRNYF